MGDSRAADKAERQDILKAVVAELNTRGLADARVDIDLSIVRSDGRRLVLDMGPVYSELLEMSARYRPEAIRTRLDAVVDATLPQSWADAGPLLRPVLRTAPYAGLIRSDRGVPWVRPLSGFVHELVVLDLPLAPMVVMQHDTRAWGVTAEQLFAVARSNLAKRYPVLPLEQRQSMQLDEHGFPDVAVLAPSWLASFAQPGEARPLAFLPGDGTLVLGTDDPEWVSWLYEYADGLYRRAERPLSPQGFTVDEGGVLVAFEQVGPHPSRRSAIAARATVACAQYGVQTAWLEQLYQQSAVNVYVARATGLTTPDGLVSCTIWGDFRIYELPETDYVFFLDGESRDRFLVPFAVVLELTGIRPTPGLYPPRYRVSGWPEPEVVAALRRHAVQR
ncbi:MAG: hypothetical protein ACSLE6_08085 [Mycobacterium sp.]